MSCSLADIPLPTPSQRRGWRCVDEPKQELTTAECRVLRLMAASRSRSEIADELFISIRTVQHHSENMGANSVCVVTMR